MNNSIRKKTKDLNKHYTKEDNQMAIKHMKSSVQFSRSVVSNPLRPHELQHARHPHPSPTSRAYSNSYSSGQWCHPAISSSVVSFTFGLQSFPASGSLPVSSSHHVAKVLKFQPQHYSFQWIFRDGLLQNGLVGSPCSPRYSQESSPTS